MSPVERTTTGLKEDGFDKGLIKFRISELLLVEEATSSGSLNPCHPGGVSGAIIHGAPKDH